MQCPACEHQAPPESFGQPACCPACGAYYEKALARKQVAQEPKTPAPPTVSAKLLKGLAGAKAAYERERSKPPRFKFYCTSCGQPGDGKRYVPGSLLVEIVLWICFILPGIIYSVWRLASAKKACHRCNTPALIPIDSPRAQRELS